MFTKFDKHMLFVPELESSQRTRETFLVDSNFFPDLTSSILQTCWQALLSRVYCFTANNSTDALCLLLSLSLCIPQST